VCYASVDYLIRPVEILAEVARIVLSGGPFVCSFSNRCFPTIVEQYFWLAEGWSDVCSERRTPSDHDGDPLFAVWAYQLHGAPSMAGSR